MVDASDTQMWVGVNGLELPYEFSSVDARLIRERIATETRDAYGRPIRRIAERLVIHNAPSIAHIAVAPSAVRALPRATSALSNAASRILWRCYGCLLGLLATALVVLALPLALVAGYVWSGRTAGGGLVGLGAWALAVLLLALGPRGR